MAQSTFEAIQAIVAEVLADRIVDMTSVESSDWSCVYTVTRSDGRRVFVKGVPRSRPEAHVTLILSEMSPQHVPRVLHFDLMPDDSGWQWFLLEDAGEALAEDLTVDEALQTVFILGRVQREAAQLPHLAQQVPNGEPENFRGIVREIVEWAVKDMPEKAADLRGLLMAIEHAPKFDRVVNVLGGLSTCVHGDLWYGNVAHSLDRLVLLDWADAIWSAGGISVLNFIQTAEGKLDGYIAELWRAWGEGIGMQPTPDYIEACTVAHCVTSLVIDREIALCCAKSASWLPGLIPGLKQLAHELSG